MLYIASDHGGYQLKKHIVNYLKSVLRVDFEDLGARAHDPADDFPDYAIPLAQKTAMDSKNRGIMICRSGLGGCITANKIKGARAILGYNITAAEIGRRHNNANILCLAGDVLSSEHADAIVKKFLDTNFEADERLLRRDQKIATLEK